MATLGLDWKGDPLNRPDDVTDAEKPSEVGRQAMSAFVPFFGLQERVREDGIGALNPAKSCAQKVSRLFDELEALTAEKQRIADERKKQGRKVDADHPTPEYERLHRRFRDLNERLHRESGGEYGYRYKTPYAPGGSGGYFDDVREDSGRYYFDDVEEGSGSGYFDDVKGGGVQDEFDSWVEEYAK